MVPPRYTQVQGHPKVCPSVPCRPKVPTHLGVSSTPRPHKIKNLPGPPPTLTSSAGLFHQCRFAEPARGTAPQYHYCSNASEVDHERPTGSIYRAVRHLAFRASLIDLMPLICYQVPGTSYLVLFDVTRYQVSPMTRNACPSAS